MISRAPRGMYGEKKPKANRFPNHAGISTRTVNILDKMMKKSSLSPLQIKAMKKSALTTGRLPSDAKRGGNYMPVEKAMSRREYLRQPIKKYYTTKRSKGTIEHNAEVSALKNKVYEPSKGADMSKENRTTKKVIPPTEPEPILKSRIEELEDEIEERYIFLADMEELGKAAEYKDKIGLEISVRQAQIRRLQKQNTKK
ncbi:hypothetical protein AAMO2058_001180100 [Amorphochlora amoebiformis]